MCVVNTDAKYYVKKTPETCLHHESKVKKKNYLKAFLKQYRNFSPFVISVKWLLGVEAEATLKRIASRLTTKWKKPYYSTYGYVKSHIATTLVRVTHRCIQDPGC